MVSSLWNKKSTFYHYNNMFKNGDLKVVNGNSGLQKSRLNTIAIIASINKIMEQNLDKAPHITHSISQDGTREPLKLLPSTPMRVSQDKCCVPCDCVSFNDPPYPVVLEMH
jgi:hypothetical protein